MIICPTCGAQSSDGAVYCDECGSSLQISTSHTVVQESSTQVGSPPEGIAAVDATICQVCGAPAQPEGRFCENCGASLVSDTTQPGISGVKLPPTVTIPGAQVSGSAITAPGTPSSSDIPAVSPTLPPPSLTCTNCGAILEPDSAFCDMCGTPVKVSLLAADPPSPPVSVPSDVQQPPPVGDISSNATVVGGYEIQQDNGQPPVDGGEIQQHYAATQVGNYTDPTSLKQKYKPNAVQQDSNKQSSSVFKPPGSAQSRLVIAGTAVRLLLPPGKATFIVGREDPIANIYPDIDLTNYGGDESGVSRQHARITLQGNQYYISDLQSTNFTYVNQQRLQPNLPTPLHDGDEIKFGRLTMLFYQS